MLYLVVGERGNRLLAEPFLQGQGGDLRKIRRCGSGRRTWSCRVFKGEGARGEGKKQGGSFYRVS